MNCACGTKCADPLCVNVMPRNSLHLFIVSTSVSVLGSEHWAICCLIWETLRCSVSSSGGLEKKHKISNCMSIWNWGFKPHISTLTVAEFNRKCWCYFSSLKDFPVFEEMIWKDTLSLKWGAVKRAERLRVGSRPRTSSWYIMVVRVPMPSQRSVEVCVALHGYASSCLSRPLYMCHSIFRVNLLSCVKSTECQWTCQFWYIWEMLPGNEHRPHWRTSGPQATLMNSVW